MTKSMPYGRINEYLATLTEEQKQRTAIKHGKLFADSTVKIWKTRQAMARAVRKEERNAPVSH